MRPNPLFRALGWPKSTRILRRSDKHSSAMASFARPDGPSARVAVKAVAATVLLGGLGIVGMVGVGAGVAAASTVPICSSGSCTVTFPTGGLQTFTVPVGVGSLAVTVEGAAAPPFVESGTVDGGMSAGTLVTGQGMVYQVLVGELGSAGQATAGNGGAAVSGGGAAGGNAPDDGSGFSSTAGAGGGGGSFVFDSTGVPLLVAGGAGGNAGAVCTGGVGGGAGALPGAGGGTPTNESVCTPGAGGAGGTPAGGAAGPGAVGGGDGTPGSGPAANGFPGAGGAGGAGSTTSGNGSSSGGGGGGGYYGGGGGGGGEGQGGQKGAGGGGGSGYAAPSVADPGGAAGFNSGPGVVTFTYMDPVSAGSPMYNTSAGEELDGLPNSLFAGDSAPPGDNVSAMVVTGEHTAAGGTVTIHPDGSFQYTPPTSYTGPDSFMFVLDSGDAAGDYATGTATVGVEATSCPAGSYGAMGDTPCTLAPAGSYDSGTGNATSTPCPAGTDTAGDTGAAACTPAPAGSYDSGTGNATSTPCPAGTDTAGDTGAAACTPARAGSYDSGTGNATSTPCPAGTDTAGDTGAAA